MSETLLGRRLLVVEDDFLIADDLAFTLRAEGAEIVGPVGNIADALDLLDKTERLDGAIVDLNLHGLLAYPIADALMARGIPFTFASGYDQGAILPGYAMIPLCQKPVSTERLRGSLFG